MFYNLSGKISDIFNNQVVLNCNGVGFLVNVSSFTMSQMKPGEAISLYMSESITETSFDLYGFYSLDEKKLYELLISVSGIGPKAAMSVLSYNKPDSLIFAIINSDDKAISAAPGIGKKTASRIILELKDKISKDYNAVEYSKIASSTAAVSNNSSIAEAKAALQVLGFNLFEINNAINRLDCSALTAEQIIKSALKIIKS